MTDAPDDDYKPTTFIYIGRGKTADEKTGGKIISTELLARCGTREQAEQRSSFFLMKDRELPHAIGFVYSVKAKLDEEGKITGIRGEYRMDSDQSANLHRFNKEWLAHWQAHDLAKQVETRAKKLEAKHDRNELRARLDPLRKDYLSTDKIGRLALEVVILDIMRNG